MRALIFLVTLQSGYCVSIDSRRDRKLGTGKAVLHAGSKRDKFFAEIAAATADTARGLRNIRLGRRPGRIFYDLHSFIELVYLCEFNRRGAVSKASLSYMRYCVWIVKDIDPIRNLCT